MSKNKYSGHMCDDCPNCGYWRRGRFYETTAFKIVVAIIFIVLLIMKELR